MKNVDRGLDIACFVTEDYPPVKFVAHLKALQLRIVQDTICT